jgi:hypothetical protein
MWNADGDADTAAEAIRARLESGDLQLTGNFRGHEAEISAQAGDWEEVQEK